MTAHHCPATPCGAQVEAGKLLCKTHWYLVPAKLRRQVNAAWRALCDSNSNYAEAINRYRHARDAAILAAQEAMP